jgi:hypothetical protein
VHEVETGYAVAGPNVLHEMIDGEVVAIQLELGNYYSLTGSAAAAWALLVAGHSHEDTSRLLREHYDAPDGLDPALSAFIAETVSEQLLAPNPAVEAPEAIEFPDGPYTTPALEKFDDMADLLLLDPIHEVDETGWPAVRPPDQG